MNAITDVELLTTSRALLDVWACSSCGLLTVVDVLFVWIAVLSNSDTFLSSGRTLGEESFFSFGLFSSCVSFFCCFSLISSFFVCVCVWVSAPCCCCCCCCWTCWTPCLIWFAPWILFLLLLILLLFASAVLRNRTSPLWYLRKKKTILN